MGRAYGVAAHVFHDLHLTDEGRLVDCGAQGAKVVVQADTLDFARLAIELETTLGSCADGAYAYTLVNLVDGLLPVFQRNHHVI